MLTKRSQAVICLVWTTRCWRWQLGKQPSLDGLEFMGELQREETEEDCKKPEQVLCFLHKVLNKEGWQNTQDCSSSGHAGPDTALVHCLSWAGGTWRAAGAEGAQPAPSHLPEHRVAIGTWCHKSPPQQLHHQEDGLFVTREEPRSGPTHRLCHKLPCSNHPPKPLIFPKISSSALRVTSHLPFAY